MTYNKTILAQLNKKIVIDLIRKQGPINKAEIARIAGLSIPTVMKITDEFEKQHLVRNIGKGESTGGKRPDLLEFVYDAYYIVGADIGRHSVKIVIMDMASHVLMQKSISTQDKDIEIPEKFLEKVADAIEELIQKSNIEKDRFMGIGIGVPGILDYKSGNIIFSPDFGWENLHIKKIFQEKFTYKIIIENTNKALAMGEFTYGASRETYNSFYINLGYGIGAASIEDGKVLYGKHGASGEFGHMIMKMNGPKCDCGNKGCLEALASGNAIAKKMKQNLQDGKESAIARFLAAGQDIEAKMVFDAARSGDLLSREIIEEAMEYLGMAIAGIINLLDPEMIVLAGGITKGKDVFSNQLLSVIDTYKMKYLGKNVKIKFGELGEYGTAIGVASMFMNAFIENGGEY